MASVACSRAMPLLSMISGSRSALEAAVKLTSCTVIFRMVLACPVGVAGTLHQRIRPLVCRDSIHVNSWSDWSWLAGKTREAGLKRALLVGIALFIASAAPAEEMK